MIANENTNAVSVRSGESGQSPKNLQKGRISGQIVFDALRRLILQETDAALKRLGRPRRQRRLRVGKKAATAIKSFKMRG